MRPDPTRLPHVTLVPAVVFLALLLFPVLASAVTVDQLVALSKAGVSDAVILALLERDRTVLTIEPGQVATLKREGLSDTLITAMLKSGRAEGEEAARAVSAERESAVLSGLASAPQVVIVGHGPDRPDTIHTEDWYATLRDGVRIPPPYAYGSPYAIPYGVPITAGAYPGGYKHSSSAHRPPKDNRMLCFAQVNTPRCPGPGYITECPDVMQRALAPR